MDEYTINFETLPVTIEESETEDFKKLIKRIKETGNKYLYKQSNEINAICLFSEIESIMEEYKYEHPCSTFNIRPDSKYAYERAYLTVQEIAELHKKYCRYHKDKKEYTNMEVNNMLFDLKLIKQLSSYVSPAVCADIPSHNNKICTEDVLVKRRVFQYIGE